MFAADLVAELNDQYPERCPSPKDPEREIWMEAGRRDLVRHLLLRLELSKDPRRALEVSTDG
jgi:hypothetical protein